MPSTKKKKRGGQPTFAIKDRDVWDARGHAPADEARNPADRLGRTQVLLPLVEHQHDVLWNLLHSFGGPFDVLDVDFGGKIV